MGKIVSHKTMSHAMISFGQKILKIFRRKVDNVHNNRTDNIFQQIKYGSLSKMEKKNFTRLNTIQSLYQLTLNLTPIRFCLFVYYANFTIIRYSIT